MSTPTEDPRNKADVFLEARLRADQKWALAITIPEGPQWETLRMLRRGFLADIDAKRIVLEEARKYIPGQSGYGMAQCAIRGLCRSYSAHPDYLEDWWPL